jgi:excisionase family DNA binding protein
MDIAAEQWELFPLLANEAPPKSKFRQWMDAWATHGPLLTPTLAASALNISRQRVHQLVEKGRIESLEVAGERLIPSTAIEKFLAAERGPGFRRNTRFGLGEIFSEADRVAQKIVEK